MSSIGEHVEYIVQFLLLRQMIFLDSLHFASGYRGRLSILAIVKALARGWSSVGLRPFDGRAWLLRFWPSRQCQQTFPHCECLTLEYEKPGLSPQVSLAALPLRSPRVALLWRQFDSQALSDPARASGCIGWALFDL